ncbi:protein TraD [Neisseria gonorrhoeae]|nr:protein TraD [Neisseria gonorrhoeae]
MPESEAKSAVKTGRNLDTMKLGSFLKAKKHNEPLIDALGGILSNDRSYFEKLVSSLYPLLEKLTTGEVAKLISPDTEDLSDPKNHYGLAQSHGIECRRLYWIGFPI